MQICHFHLYLKHSTLKFDFGKMLESIKLTVSTEILCKFEWKFDNPIQKHVHFYSITIFLVTNLCSHLFFSSSTYFSCFWICYIRIFGSYFFYILFYNGYGYGPINFSAHVFFLCYGAVGYFFQKPKKNTKKKRRNTEEESQISKPIYVEPFLHGAYCQFIFRRR